MELGKTALGSPTYEEAETCPSIDYLNSDSSLIWASDSHTNNSHSFSSTNSPQVSGQSLILDRLDQWEYEYNMSLVPGEWELSVAPVV